MNNHVIHVCPLSRLDETVRVSGATRLVTLLTAGSPFQRPAEILPENHLCLWMNDIADEQQGLVAPGMQHVERLIGFAEDWARNSFKAGPLAVHCYAGVSRSTAGAYIIAAALAPEWSEEELARTLRKLSPSATPNPRLIRHADEILCRQGRMIAAIAAIGRGADTYEGTPFVLPLSPQ